MSVFARFIITVFQYDDSFNTPNYETYEWKIDHLKALN